LIDLAQEGKRPNLPVYALATSNAKSNWVAVATQDGIFVSEGASFRRPEGWPGDKDVQTLAFQEVGEDIFLWAGTAAAGWENGSGCRVLRLTAGKEEPIAEIIHEIIAQSKEKSVDKILEKAKRKTRDINITKIIDEIVFEIQGTAKSKTILEAIDEIIVKAKGTTTEETWGPYIEGWVGGSCNGLAFFGSKVLAATHHNGVLWLNFDGDTRNLKAKWESPDIAICDLPPRDPGPFQPVAALATNWKPSRDDPSSDRRELMVVMASVVREVEAHVVEGVYRYCNMNEKGDIKKEDVQYEFLSHDVYTERVTLPPTWLFVSEKHEVLVLSEGQEGM